ncbi:hypothetical protein NFI96_001716 [Prochilodus magdalenae]|nr:hypothetical protein NFI96_001716 [Prochilodus magdalenae]
MYFNENKTLHPDHSNLDWMECIPGDTSLSSVSIPGTHQSLKSGGIHDPRNFQAWELPAQLYVGVRFFDMTLWTLFGTLYVENNALVYYEKFSHVLSHLQVFLKDKRKSDTVLLRLTGPSKSISRAKEELDSATAVEVWKKQTIPTMDEARGKIILIQSSDFDWGLPVTTTELGTDKKESEMKDNIKKASEKCAHEMMLTDTGAKGLLEEL